MVGKADQQDALERPETVFAKPSRGAVLAWLEHEFEIPRNEPDPTYTETLMAAFRRLPMKLTSLPEHLRTLRHLTRSRMALLDLTGRFSSQTEALNALTAENRALREAVSALESTLESMGNRMMRELARLDQTISIQRRSYADITSRLARLSTSHGQQDASGQVPVSDPFLDVFYREFEDRYRGSREEILLRLQGHLPHVSTLKDRKNPRIVDLGCGRGEWLELLREEGLPALGVDSNEFQAAAAKELGLDVEIADAIGWLSLQKDRSIDFLSAFHVIEHLEFPVVVRLLKEAVRVLKPGGGLLLETPNPETLVVSASTFWLDPTHVRPYMPETMSTLLEALSFHDIEILRLQPHPYNHAGRDFHGLEQPAADLLYGARDYAIICRRG